MVGAGREQQSDGSAIYVDEFGTSHRQQIVLQLLGEFTDWSTHLLDGVSEIVVLNEN